MAPSIVIEIGSAASVVSWHTAGTAGHVGHVGHTTGLGQVEHVGHLKIWKNFLAFASVP